MSLLHKYEQAGPLELQVNIGISESYPKVLNVSKKTCTTYWSLLWKIHYQLTTSTTYIFTHLLTNCSSDVIDTSKDFLELCDVVFRASLETTWWSNWVERYQVHNLAPNNINNSIRKYEAFVVPRSQGITYIRTFTHSSACVSICACMGPPTCIWKKLEI